MNKTVSFAVNLCAWLAVYSFPAYAQSSIKEGSVNCRLHVAAALDMHTLVDGRVTIPVQLNGHDHRLMVDTGGFVNTVTPQLIQNEGYSPSASGGVLQGIGKRQLTTSVAISDFAIGNAHNQGATFFVDVFDSMLADGTLAPNVLVNYDIDFDFGHDKFNLIQSDHCPSEVVYWTKEPRAVVPFELEDRSHIHLPIGLDGKEVMATVDSGSVTSIMTMGAASRLLGITAQTPGIESLGTISVNGVPSAAYVYSPKSLTLGGITIRDAQIHIVSDALWNKDDVLLGVDVLRELHVYIAYGERKLYLTPALAK